MLKPIRIERVDRLAGYLFEVKAIQQPRNSDEYVCIADVVACADSSAW